MNNTQSHIQSIEDKVASILRFTNNYSGATAKKNETERVTSLLTFAEHFAESDNFDSAFDQIKRAYRLHPTDERIPVVEHKLLKLKTDKEIASKNPTVEISDSEYEKRLGITHERYIIRKLLVEAEILREKKDYSLALKKIAEATAEDPFNEKIIECEQRLRQEYDEPLDVTGSLLHQANLLRKDKNYREALSLVKKAYEVDPLNDSIAELEETIKSEMRQEISPGCQHILAAWKYLHEHKYGKALEEIECAYKLDPLNDKIAELEKEIRQLKLV